MKTTNIEQYYNQARHWTDAKLNRQLLGRSTGTDVPLVLAITLAKISRTINSQNKQPPKNVLEDPTDLLEYLVQESIICTDVDKEITLSILFSIAERYLEECDQLQEKPLQAILRACAQICQTYANPGLNVAAAVRTLEKISQTKLTWSDVVAFGKGESLQLGVHFEVGQKLPCKIRCQVMNGYATLLLGNEQVAGILKTEKKLEIGTWVDAYFISVEKNRAWLSLTPPT